MLKLGGLLLEGDMKIHETVEALNGNKIERIKSSLFYWLGFICLPVGIFLITKEIWVGAFLTLTASPCFFLYPPVRFLFGGKDSVAAVIVTVVVEEVIKSKIKEIGNKKKKKC